MIILIECSSAEQYSRTGTCCLRRCLNKNSTHLPRQPQRFLGIHQSVRSVSSAPEWLEKKKNTKKLSQLQKQCVWDCDTSPAWLGHCLTMSASLSLELECSGDSLPESSHMFGCHHLTWICWALGEAQVILCRWQGRARQTFNTSHSLKCLQPTWQIKLNGYH